MKKLIDDTVWTITCFRLDRAVVRVEERFQAGHKRALEYIKEKSAQFSDKRFVFQILFQACETEPAKQVGLGDLQNYVMIWGDDDEEDEA